MNDLIFCGFFTKDTPYEGEFKALEFYFRAFSLKYDYMGIKNRGSWQRNTQAKADVVLAFLLKYSGQRICYLDVDSVIIKRPVDLFEVKADIAAPICFGHEFISSCMPMLADSRTLELVERWRDLNAKYPDVLPNGQAAWDQRTLWMAIQERQKIEAITFEALSPGYHYMADLHPTRHPGVEPVIMAARGAVRFRSQIDGGFGSNF